MEKEVLRKRLVKILDELTAVGRECREHDKLCLEEYDHALIHVDRATKQIEELIEDIGR